MFGQQVQPALTFAADVWGAKKIKEIQKVHMYACKKVLSVSQRTPNTMIYREFGRYPLYINTVMKSVKYWLRPDTVVQIQPKSLKIIIKI